MISGIPPSHSQFYMGLGAEDEKKTVYGAFEEGDRYFNFGDVVYVDHDYYIYFRDRTGDTFRYMYKVNKSRKYRGSYSTHMHMTCDFPFEDMKNFSFFSTSFNRIANVRAGSDSLTMATPSQKHTLALVRQKSKVITLFCLACIHVACICKNE